MRKRNLIFILLFALCLVLPRAAWTGLRAFAPESYAALNEELGEKRKMNSVEWDRLWSDCSSVSRAFDDRVPFRSAVIAGYQSVTGKAERNFDKKLLTPLMQWAMNGRKTSGGDKPPAESAAETKPAETVPAGTLPYVGPAKPTETAESSAAETKPAETESSPAETLPETTETETAGCPHAFEQTVLREADCENGGEVRYLCSLCGETRTETLPAYGHEKKEIGRREADCENWGYTDYACERCGRIFRENVTEPVPDESYLTPRTVGSGVIPGKYDWLFFANDGSLDYYKGTNLLSEEEMAAYAEKLNTLQALCAERNIRLVVQFLPNKEQVYDRYMPDYSVEETYKRTARLADHLREHTDVTVFYPLEELKAADLYHRTYYKYDTHWTYYGAYVGTMELLRALGIEGEDPYDLRREGVVCWDGYMDLISVGGLRDSGLPWQEEFKPDCLADVEILWEEGLDNDSVLRSESSNENGLNLVYFGDSFRTMQAEYLERSFSKCLIAHRDYLSSAMKTEILESHVLVLSAVERNDTRIFDSADRLIAMLSE